MKILSGVSLYGTDILVAKRDLARAQEIAGSLVEAEEEIEEGDGGAEDGDDMGSGS